VTDIGHEFVDLGPIILVIVVILPRGTFLLSTAFRQTGTRACVAIEDRFPLSVVGLEAQGEVFWGGEGNAAVAQEVLQVGYSTFQVIHVAVADSVSEILDVRAAVSPQVEWIV